MSDKVRIFIGTSSNGEDAHAEIAYEHSLRKNTSRELEIVWMRQGDGFWSGWNTHTWSTPFSGFRWGIPEYCGFEGLAIYTDVDMVNYRDISLILDAPLGDKWVAARRGRRFGGREFCVMVMDCAKFKGPVGHFPSVKELRARNLHHTLVHDMQSFDLVADLDPRWNCLDGEDRPLEDIWQLHFTDMATQPWHPKWYTGSIKEHPRPDVVAAWFRALDEARGIPYMVPLPMDPPIKYDIIGR